MGADMKKLVVLRHTHVPGVQMLSDWYLYNGNNCVYKCKGLELPWLNNAPQVSCIPAGDYEAVLDYSPAFKYNLFELKGVPNRAEVKIHIANFARELRGCLAPGRGFAHVDKDGNLDVTSSGDTLRELHTAILPDKVIRVVIVDLFN